MDTVFLALFGRVQGARFPIFVKQLYTFKGITSTVRSAASTETAMNSEGRSFNDEMVFLTPWTISDVEFFLIDCS